MRNNDIRRGAQSDQAMNDSGVKPVIINIVSGKGGTGKSLVTAVLGRLLGQAGANVLLVDLDIYVRGLTHLYYLHKKQKRELTDKETVASFLSPSEPFEGAMEEVKHAWFQVHPLARERFFEADLVPAVRSIEEQVDFLEVSETAISQTQILLKLLKKTKHDYILLDNRAGVDALILESSKRVDLTISIAEDDPISRTTNDNLLRHLGELDRAKIYTILNKVKFIRTRDDYEREMLQIKGDFGTVGKIPFDVDLFEMFGTDKFWNTLSQTSFFYALGDAWNRIAMREDFTHSVNTETGALEEKTTKKLADVSPNFLSYTERLSLLAGMVSIFGYLGFDLFAQRNWQIQDVLLLYAFVFVSIPLVRRYLRRPGQ